MIKFPSWTFRVFGMSKITTKRKNRKKITTKKMAETSASICLLLATALKIFVIKWKPFFTDCSDSCYDDYTTMPCVVV